MGRGSSKVTKANTLNFDGDVVELDGEPLKYGEKDYTPRGFTGESAAVEAFENKRYKSKVEYATVIDEDGNVLEETRGGKGSVRTSGLAMMDGKTLSHVHPREKGELGGTFSEADLRNWAAFDNMRTYRATCKEGTYSISKQAGFKRYMVAEYADAQRRIMADAKAKHKTATNDYKRLPQ